LLALAHRALRARRFTTSCWTFVTLWLLLLVSELRLVNQVGGGACCGLVLQAHLHVFWGGAAGPPGVLVTLDATVLSLSVLTVVVVVAAQAFGCAGDAHPSLTAAAAPVVLLPFCVTPAGPAGHDCLRGPLLRALAVQAV
jgi:hypothetical protein